MSSVKKVVLAYSGGLDTSIILRWLQHTYACEVVTFTADIGQGEEIWPAKNKAKVLGASDVFIQNLTEEFAHDFIFPMFRANTVYEGEYLLGTAIARPLIAKYLVYIAHQVGADAIAHGATGKGNDQVRFELSAYSLAPDIRIIVPWREWEFNSREDLLNYASLHAIPIEADSSHAKPYSMDANLLHISYEGNELEDPWVEPTELMWRRTRSLENALPEPQYLELVYEHGDVVSVDGKRMTPAQVLVDLNAIGGKHGIGRLDIVENRYVGMKSRGCYETPAGNILLRAHRAIESITLDREAAHLKDELMPRYASLIYNGYWWSEERYALQALIDQTQQSVSGVVRLKLYKGNVLVVGRRSSGSLFDAKIATFENNSELYNQRDAEGFIRLNALRLRIAARKRQREVREQ